MSLESVPFDKQLTKIERYEQNLRDAERRFRGVYLRPKVFDNREIYLNRLMTFQAWAVPASKPMLVPLGDVERPLQVNPLEEVPMPSTEEKPRFVFSYPLAGLLGIINIMTGILGFYDKIPPVTLFYVIVLSICVALSSFIADFVRDWLKRKGEAKPVSPEDQVKLAFAEMVREFERDWKLIKIQSQDKEKLPNYEQLGTDDAVFNREAQFEADLSFKATKLSGVVMNICTENLQVRRDTVIAHMASVQRNAVKVQ